MGHKIENELRAIVIFPSYWSIYLSVSSVWMYMTADKIHSRCVPECINNLWFVLFVIPLLQLRSSNRSCYHLHWEFINRTSEWPEATGGVWVRPVDITAFIYSLLCLCLGDGNSKISSVYINNTHGMDDDDFYDRNLALFEVRNHCLL